MKFLFLLLIHFYHMGHNNIRYRKTYCLLLFFWYLKQWTLDSNCNFLLALQSHKQDQLEDVQIFHSDILCKSCWTKYLTDRNLFVKPDNVVGQSSLSCTIVPFYQSFGLRCISENHFNAKFIHHNTKWCYITFRTFEDSMFVWINS